MGVSCMQVYRHIRTNMPISPLKYDVAFVQLFLPAGIEPASIPSEGTILSIERREVVRNKKRIHRILIFSERPFRKLRLREVFVARTLYDIYCSHGTHSPIFKVGERGRGHCRRQGRIAQGNDADRYSGPAGIRGLGGCVREISRRSESEPGARYDFGPRSEIGRASC